MSFSFSPNIPQCYPALTYIPYMRVGRIRRVLKWLTCSQHVPARGTWKNKAKSLHQTSPTGPWRRPRAHSKTGLITHAPGRVVATLVKLRVGVSARKRQRGAGRPTLVVVEEKGKNGHHVNQKLRALLPTTRKLAQHSHRHVPAAVRWETCRSGRKELDPNPAAKAKRDRLSPPTHTTATLHTRNRYTAFRTMPGTHARAVCVENEHT